MNVSCVLLVYCFKENFSWKIKPILCVVTNTNLKLISTVTLYSDKVRESRRQRQNQQHKEPDIHRYDRRASRARHTLGALCSSPQCVSAEWRWYYSSVPELRIRLGCTVEPGWSYHSPSHPLSLLPAGSRSYQQSDTHIQTHRITCNSRWVKADITSHRSSTVI